MTNFKHSVDAKKKKENKLAKQAVSAHMRIATVGS